MRERIKGIVIDAALWSFSIAVLVGCAAWALNNVNEALSDSWVPPTTLTME